MKGAEAAEQWFGQMRGEDSGYVAFESAGASVVGEFHCSGCGYGVVVHRELPMCPICSGSVWEQSTWSPFRRARAAERRR